jgi:hypothetical protein
LRKAEERLKELRTAEGVPLLENTRGELLRDIARLRMIREQIKESSNGGCAISKLPLPSRVRMRWFA